MSKPSKTKGLVSAGLHSCQSRSLKNEIRKNYLASSARLENQLKAFKQGKRVVLSVPNPIKTETNKPFVRVLAKDYWKNTSKGY